MASRAHTRGWLLRTCSEALLLLLFSTAVKGQSPNITIGPVSVQLQDLVQAYDGEPKAVTIVTDPPGVPVSVSYDGMADAPTDSGSYTVTAVVALPLAQGIAKGTFTISPVITNVAVPVAGAFEMGQTLSFTVSYCGPVQVNTNAGLPTLPLTIGSVPRNASFTASDSSTLTFSYTIQAADSGAVVLGANIDLNGATIQDSGGYDASLSFTPADTEGLKVVSSGIKSPPGDSVTLTAVDSSTLLLTVHGEPATDYAIQGTAELANPTWAFIGAATSDTNGVATLRFPPQPGTRFFRSVRQVGEPPR